MVRANAMIPRMKDSPRTVLGAFFGPVLVLGVASTTVACVSSPASEDPTSVTSSMAQSAEVGVIDPAFVAHWAVRPGDKANFVELTLRSDGTYTRTNVDRPSPESGRWNVVTHDWDWIWVQTLTLTSNAGEVSVYGATVPDGSQWAILYQNEVPALDFEVLRQARPESAPSSAR
jgi:hypothetical protein